MGQGPDENRGIDAESGGRHPFGGGVGVIEHDQHLVLRGAGVTFVVPEQRHELMRQLLSAEPIECTVHDDGFQSLANLMAVGAVEVVAERALISETDTASVGSGRDDSAERLKIMVEQAPLEIRLAAGIDPRLAQEIRRSLSGHPASSASPLARVIGSTSKPSCSASDTRRFLPMKPSAPVIRISVWVGVLMDTPSGAWNTTGCEKPSARLRSLPCMVAR